jgi:hypothetical protein
MDLVTLITACALNVEPKLMHALIWKQSGRVHHRRCGRPQIHPRCDHRQSTARVAATNAACEGVS